MRVAGWRALKISWCRHGDSETHNSDTHEELAGLFPASIVANSKLHAQENESDLLGELSRAESSPSTRLAAHPPSFALTL